MHLLTAAPFPAGSCSAPWERPSAMKRSRFRSRCRRLMYCALGYALVIALASAARGEEPPSAHVELFEKKIRPVLVEHCYKCHSMTAKKVRGGLLPDSRE